MVHSAIFSQRERKLCQEYLYKADFSPGEKQAIYMIFSRCKKVREQIIGDFSLFKRFLMEYEFRPEFAKT